MFIRNLQRVPPFVGLHPSRTHTRKFLILGALIISVHNDADVPAWVVESAARRTTDSESSTLCIPDRNFLPPSSSHTWCTAIVHIFLLGRQVLPCLRLARVRTSGPCCDVHEHHLSSATAIVVPGRPRDNHLHQLQKWRRNEESLVVDTALRIEVFRHKPASVHTKAPLSTSTHRTPMGARLFSPQQSWTSASLHNRRSSCRPNLF